MTPFRIAVMVLVIVAALLAAISPCYAERTGDDAAMNFLSAELPVIPGNHSGPPACNVPEHKEYRVVQGEPFTYTGKVPENANLSVDVYVFTDTAPILLPWQQPVDANGTFSFTLSGNGTREDWEDYLRYRSAQRSVFFSPYDHICLHYSTGSDCFDLQIVQDIRNLTMNMANDWIRIDPLPDRVISKKEMSEYSGNFFINGTTNLAQGTELSLTMGSTCMLPCPKMVSDDIGCCGSNYERVTSVLEGPCGVNTWSFPVNSSPYRIKMMGVNGKYGDTNGFLVYVIRKNQTQDGNEWDLAQFFIRSREEIAPVTTQAQTYVPPSSTQAPLSLIGTGFAVTVAALLLNICRTRGR